MSCLRVNLRCHKFKQSYEIFLHAINKIFIPFEKKILYYEQEFDFKKRFGTTFIFGKFLDATAPDSKKKYITNKIAFLIDEVQEKYITKHLYQLLNKYNNIVMAYGM